MSESNLTAFDKLTIEGIQKRLKKLEAIVTPPAEPKSEPKEQQNAEPKIVEAEQPEGKWQPKVGETYYFVSLDGNHGVSEYTWDGGYSDKNLYNYGNCFQTEEIALSRASLIKAVLQHQTEVKAFLNTLKK